MNICNDLIREILYFSHNEDVINFCKVNKRFNTLTNDEVLKNYIIYRDHPMVFNVIGNYCPICNLKLTFLTGNTDFSICHHIYP